MEKQVLGILLIVVGIAFVSGGLLVLVRKTPEPSVSSRAAPPLASHASTTDPAPSESKGRRFEEWVVKKFNPGYFSIKEWRSDKFVDGIYAESSRYPDLEIEFRLKDRRSSFAVECKWRTSFTRGNTDSSMANGTTATAGWGSRRAG